MQLYRWCSETGMRRPPTKGIWCIGNFDGCHHGHQSLLQQAYNLAEKQNRSFGVITFEPHPRDFFCHARSGRLFSIRQKLSLMRSMGVSHLVMLSFNAELANMSADSFISVILQDYLQANTVIVGHDFRFGYKRQGGIEELQAAGLIVQTLTPQCDEQGQRYASRHIRGLIEQGNMTAARQALGFDWYVSGRVCYGQQMGQKLGVPTANLNWPRGVVRPPYGVYVVKMQLQDGVWYPAIANWGIRPTLGEGAEPILEVHVFDKQIDLYGQRLKVAFGVFLRPQQKFPNLAALQMQIFQDCQQARQAHKQWEA